VAAGSAGGFVAEAPAVMDPVLPLSFVASTGVTDLPALGVAAPTAKVLPVAFAASTGVTDLPALAVVVAALPVLWGVTSA